MAGHSHFKNMAHRKGIVDAKRAKLWSKLSRYIMIAAKNGGGDPISNLKLRYAIDKARSVSMPKDNIERAIKKGTGELGGQNFDEVTYEAYGPGGVAILIETLTDNRNRTNGEVRSILEKGGGKMGTPGSVAYLFERKGVLAIPAKDIDEDALMGIALEAGADDLELTGDDYEITCDAGAFNQVRASLEANNITPRRRRNPANRQDQRRCRRRDRPKDLENDGHSRRQRRCAKRLFEFERDRRDDGGHVSDYY